MTAVIQMADRMKAKRRKAVSTRTQVVKAVGAGVAGFAATQAGRADTQITFEGFSGNNVNISTLAGYGSKVSASSADYTVSLGAGGMTGTPDISLTWGVGFQTYTGWDGRGKVAQLDFNASTNNPINLVFTPSASAGVLIKSFELDEWAGGGSAALTWSIFDSGGTLASGTWTKTDAGGRDTITTGINLSDVGIGLPVTLRISRTAGLPSYLALDNLTFDQVPEPSTVALGLVGAGLGALAMRRRKKP
jgi:hypothetical protein